MCYTPAQASRTLKTSGLNPEPGALTPEWGFPKFRVPHWGAYFKGIVCGSKLGVPYVRNPLNQGGDFLPALGWGLTHAGC